MNETERGIDGAYITLTIQKGSVFVVSAMVHYSRIMSIQRLLTLDQASVAYTLPCEMGDGLGVSICSFDEVHGWLRDYAVNGEHSE